MNNLTIRKATLDDLSILLSFEQGVIKAERPFDETLNDDPITYYDLKELIQSKEASLVIAEIGNALVASGYALVKSGKPYSKYNKYAYLGFMYTHPNYRGKGINSKIIEVLKDWSYSKGLKEIRLTVYDENLNAIRAYEKVGFKKHMIEMRLE